MLISEEVEMKWNAKNKDRFVKLGYTFTKMKDSFIVKVEDLSHGSVVKVDLKCDYCGKTYQKQWTTYLVEKEKGTIKKDCCGYCKQYKIVDVCIEKYGTTSNFLREDIKEQIKKTNLSKYGAENVFASKEIQEKIYSTNIKKYGFKSAIQNEDIKDKVSKTCMERYGVRFFVETQVFKGEQSPRWKGGISRTRYERAETEYIHWRKDVFNKDKYTCQCCGKRNGNGETIKLNAHHILNWKDNADSRYELDNGITLCENCHIFFHSEYGKRNNTKEQIEEFLLNHGKKVC